MKKTYTVKEVADLLSFSTNTVYKYLETGRIKATRLGKEGRYRIPVQEVANLLPGRHHTEIQSAQDYQTAGSSGYFDWFVGFLSMGLGFSQFIFPVYRLSILTAAFSQFLQVVHIVIFALGFVLILTDIFEMKRRGLHKSVHIVLAASFLVVASILFHTGIVPDSIGYFVTSVVVFITAFNKISGEARFLLYLNMLLALTGFGVVIFPDAFFISTLISPGSVDVIIFLVVWLISEAFVITLSIKSLRLRGAYLKTLAFLAAFVALVYSTFAFTNGYWGRAIYCTILAAFAVILPFADHFEAFTIKSKKEMLAGFVWLLGLFFVGSVVLFFIYNSFENFILKELGNRVNTANEVLETFSEGNESKISAFAGDAELVDILKNPASFDMVSAEAQLKQLYIMSNGTLRRIILVDKNGIIRSTYPFNISSQNLDISDREYFKTAKTGRKISVTGIIQPSSPGIPPAVLISSPVTDASGSFLGVLIGSADIADLTERMNRIEFGDGGKFILVDSSKKYIIPPTPDKILTSAPEDSFVAKATGGKFGTGRNYNSDGMLAFSAYQQASKYGWGIAAEQPLNHVFRTYSITGFVVFLIFLMGGIGSIVFMLYYVRKGSQR